MNDDSSRLIPQRQPRRPEGVGRPSVRLQGYGIGGAGAGLWGGVRPPLHDDGRGRRLGSGGREISPENFSEVA